MVRSGSKHERQSVLPTDAVTSRLRMRICVRGVVRSGLPALRVQRAASSGLSGSVPVTVPER